MSFVNMQLQNRESVFFIALDNFREMNLKKATDTIRKLILMK